MYSAKISQLCGLYKLGGGLFPAGELFNSPTCEEERQQLPLPDNDGPSLLLCPGKLDQRETSGVCFLPSTYI